MSIDETPTDFGVVTDPDTMEASSPSHVTGLLCFRLGDTIFPYPGCRELILDVVGEWLFPLGPMVLQVDNVVMFYFMDTAEGLWARSLGDGRVVLQGLYDDAGRERTDSFIVRMADIAQAILTAADEVVEVARAHDWYPSRRELIANMAERIRGWRDVAVWGGDPSAVPTGWSPDAASYGLPPTPTAEELCIDMTHILNCHTVGGSEATPGKSLFPAHMDERQIEVAIRQAYAEACLDWLDGVHLWGRRMRDLAQVRKDDDLEIEMWVNPVTRTIETAFPVPWREDDPSQKRKVNAIPADVRVVVDTNSLRRNAGGSITGVVYFRCGDMPLPNARWRDFVVCELTWWLKEVAQDLLVRHVSPGRARVLRFMEHHVPMLLSGAGPNRVLLGREADQGSLRIDEGFIVETTALMQSLLSAAEEVLEAVETRGWASPETEELARIHGRLNDLKRQDFW